MSDKPRTWDLTLSHGSIYAKQGQGAQFYRDGEVVQVIELEPVLDLLEPVVKQAKLVNEWKADAMELRPLIAFLREHGRLK